jgi:N-acetylglucosaminyl-diphospho-decaprenol L-rhamnosyltransferase
MRDKPRVSSIVVSWNAKEHLARCLEHLAQQAPHELIVVENGSTDGSSELLSARSDLTVIDLENPGFGAANNAGARLAKGDYLLLVNSDCELQEDALRILAQVLDENPRAGIVAPLLRHPTGRLQRSAGREPSLLTELLKKTMLHRIVKYYTYGSWSYDEDRTVDWVSGACMMVRRELFKHVGGFDERFFMFMEDLDLCKRVRDAGYDVQFTTQASAIHHGGASQSAVTTGMLLESERSVRLYFHKHHGPRAVRAIRVLSMIEAVVRSCFWLPALVAPRIRRHALSRLKAYPHLARGNLNPVADDSCVVGRQRPSRIRS